MARLPSIFRRSDPYMGIPGGDPDATADETIRAVEWATRLARQIEEREPRIRTLRDYYQGDQPLRFATKKWRETFGTQFGEVTDNWCRLVVDAAVERMSVQGFRFDADDADGDDDAWDIWQGNRLDLDSDVAHTEALVTGYSYLLVWPDAETGTATITVEDPLQTIVELDPANRRRRLAGMKRWRALDGVWHGMLFTPDRVWTFNGGSGTSLGTWQATKVEPNTYGIVPIIPMVNNPDVYGRGHSDIEDVVPLQDAANKLLSDMLIASEFAAYKQRVLLGAEIPINPETGQPDRSIVGGINRWLAIEGDGENNPSIQELSASDPAAHWKGVQALVQHIAALTRTPPQYLLAEMVNVSGDALKAAESGLVSRVERRMRLFGESWEEALRLARLIEDADADLAPRAETIWADPETISEGARVDALVKMRQLGIPEEMLWEKWGLSPEEIKRARAMRADEAIAAGLRLGVTPNGAPVEITPPAPAPAAGLELPQLPAP